MSQLLALAARSPYVGGGRCRIPRVLSPLMLTVVAAAMGAIFPPAAVAQVAMPVAARLDDLSITPAQVIHVQKFDEESLATSEQGSPRSTSPLSPSQRQHRAVAVTAVALATDGSWVAAAGDDHVVRLYDAQSGQLRHRLAGHHDWVRGLSLAADGKTLASVARDRTYCLWHTTNGEQLATSPLGKGPLSAVAFHPNGLQLATVGFRCPACVYSLSSGTLAAQFDCPCSDISAVDFSADGSKMAAAGRNGKIRIWQVSTGKVLHDIPADRRRVRAVKFSPSGERLASGGDGGEVRMWEVATGEQQQALPVRPSKVFCLAFLAEDELAVGGSDNRVQVWRLDDQPRLVKLLVGHTGSVTSLATSETGEWLASSSFDTTVRLWRMRRLTPNKVAQRPGGPQR